jgi:hypothetical protein
VNKSPRKTLGQAGLCWLVAEMRPGRVHPTSASLYWSDTAGDWAGYLRTRNRRRTKNTTLWELCTMIPISALR